ncbi:MAG: DnaJ domain-containing protein [Candidatus Sericytochromatia bacterium]
MTVELDRILKEENLFTILNVQTSASTEDIRSAYKKLVKEVHPDRFSNSNEKVKAEEAFKRLGVAFNTLRDPLMRKDYERIVDRHVGPSYGPSTSPGATARPAPPPGTGPISSTRPGPQATPNKAREETLIELAERHYQSGKAFERKNMMDDAIKEYQEAIRIRNETAKYHSQLGLALDKKGWTGYAQAEFKVALHFDPTDKLALKHYKPTAGSSQVKSGGFKFLNIFRGADKNARIGDILIKLGHLNKEQLQKALKQQSDEKLLLGEILIRMKYIKPEHLAQALIHQAETLQKQVEK